MTTTIKLTKTQREVLERAARHSRGRATVHEWTQAIGGGIGRGQKSGGIRKHNAIKRLVEMGLMAGYSVHHHSGYAPGGEWNNGNKIYSAEAAATITEAGREAIRCS